MYYKLKSNPEGKIYVSILSLCKIISKEFILVLRSDLEYNIRCNSFINKLSQYMVKSVYSNQWPGTKLGEDNKAKILNFRVNEKTIEILKKHSNGLFDWRNPDLPEDLSFLRGDGTVILGDIAHEEDYWLNFTDDELAIVKEKYLDLADDLITIKDGE